MMPTRAAKPNVTSDDLEGKLLPPEHPLAGVVWVNPDRMHGTPCFFGTRVPIQHLWDYLEGGDPLPEFLDDFEGVTEEQARAALRYALKLFLDSLAQIVPRFTAEAVKILLDYCVPKRLRRLLPGHFVRTTREMGWDQLRNGVVPAAVAAR